MYSRFLLEFVVGEDLTDFADSSRKVYLHLEHLVPAGLFFRYVLSEFKLPCKGGQAKLWLYFKSCKLTVEKEALGPGHDK